MLWTTTPLIPLPLVMSAGAFGSRVRNISRTSRSSPVVLGGWYGFTATSGEKSVHLSSLKCMHPPPRKRRNGKWQTLQLPWDYRSHQPCSKHSLWCGVFGVAAQKYLEEHTLFPDGGRTNKGVFVHIHSICSFHVQYYQMASELQNVLPLTGPLSSCKPQPVASVRESVHLIDDL